MPRFGSYLPDAWGWPWAPPLPLPFTYNGATFPQGVANADVAAIFAEALDRIVPGMREPLNWQHDCWGFEVRDVRAQPGARSFHGYGLALDLNALTNGQTTDDPLTEAGTTLPLDTGDRVRDLGIEWGGDWDPVTPRDPMHLELHLDPVEAHDLAQQLLAPPIPIEGADVSIVMFVQDATGKHDPCWFANGVRGHPMSAEQWTAANVLHRVGAVQFAPVDRATYNVFPVGQL